MNLETVSVDVVIKAMKLHRAWRESGEGGKGENKDGAQGHSKDRSDRGGKTSRGDWENKPTPDLFCSEAIKHPEFRI